MMPKHRPPVTLLPNPLHGGLGLLCEGHNFLCNRARRCLMSSDMEEMGGIARAQDGAQEWLGMLQTLAAETQKQQHNPQQMVQGMMDTYMRPLNTPGAY